MKNKNYKRVLFNFKPYECTAVEEFLEEKAKEGWLLSSITGNIFKFKKIEPKELKYSVDIFSNITMLDDEDNEISLSYREYCKEAGWNYLCGKGKIQIFYTENYCKSIPIHTDYKEKFKQVIKGSIWSIIGSVFLMVLWIVIIYQWITEVSMFKTLISSNVMLMCIFIYIGLIFYYSIEVFSFIKWIIKSRLKLKENKFLPYNSYKSIKIKNRIYKIWAIFSLVFIVAASIVEESFFSFGLISGMMLIILFALSIYLFIRFLKKRDFNKVTKITVLCISAIVMYIFCIQLTSFYLVNKVNSDEKKSVISNEDYLNLGDFGYKEVSNKIYGGKSILAENRSYFSKGQDISFFYDIFICNNRWLFKLCVDKEIQSFSKYNDESLKLEIVETSLPENITVYANNNHRGKRYYIISNNVVIGINKEFEELSEGEFLDIIYRKIFT